MNNLSPLNIQQVRRGYGRSFLSSICKTILLTILIFIAVVLITPLHSQSFAANGSSGTIAYLREGEEIRLIEPDGSHDRLLWQSPSSGIYGLLDLAWKPNATELAFSSDHEGHCSIFEVDVYAIRPDGSGLRRITNAPTCAQLAGFPKGDVTVTVQNLGGGGGGPYFVYVQGAPSILPVVVTPGNSTTVTFNDVADFGNHQLQQAVVIEGLYRWDAPIAAADVQPGQTVNAGTLQIVGGGLPNYGAHRPAWRSDGADLGFVFGGCSGLSHIAPNPPPGNRGMLLQNIFEFGCVMDWRPIPSGSDQLLYWSFLNEGIYQTTAGSDTLGTKLIDTALSGMVWQVIWLPDASGFLYSYAESILESSNIYYYSFATGISTPLTNYDAAFTRNFSLSPDGQQVVFELAPTWDDEASDLWLMQIDGSDAHLFMTNGHAPAWSSQTPQILNHTYLPIVLREES